MTVSDVNVAVRNDSTVYATKVAVGESSVMGASTGLAAIDPSFALGVVLDSNPIIFPGALSLHFVTASGTDIAVHERRTAIASITQGTTVAVYDVSGTNAI